MSKGLAGSIQRLMHFFLPKEEEFFDLFAEMCAQARVAAGQLELLFQAAPDGDIAPLVEDIARLEHEVDRLVHNAVKRLNNTFVTPIMFDRQDILDLVHKLDDVVDYTRAAADRVFLYRVQMVPAPALELTNLLTQCTEQLASLCSDLAHQRSSDHPAVALVNSLENQADKVLKQALADLFCGDTPPIEVIKWKEIYDYIEEAIDHCEDTVTVIETALVKNS